MRSKLEEATNEINKAIDGADLLFKNHSIESVATYDTVPLEVQVGITSALGRRYFELIHKLDQLMPLLQTLEIEEVISEKQAEQQRSRLKRVVLAMSSTARNFSMGCRRRMNEMDAREGEAKHSKPSPRKKLRDPGGAGRESTAAVENGEPVAADNGGHELSPPAATEVAVSLASEPAAVEAP